MERTYKKWRSPSLGIDMELLVFGSSGTPVLAFPTGEGRFYEWENEGLIDALSLQLENGYNQLFCVDTVDEESFFNADVNPYTRLMRHEQYEAYILEEVLPYIRSFNNRNFLITAGIGFGGYHASNLALKHPRKFQKLISINASYNIKPFMDDFYDKNVYFNNPVDYLSNLNDPDIIRVINQTDIRLITEPSSETHGEVKHLSTILNERFIDHQLDIWDETKVEEPGQWGDILLKHIV